MRKFEKVDSKTFFQSLLSNLSTKDLVTFGNLLSIKFLKPWKWFCGILGKPT
jgi:hypothetical protein